MKKIDITGNRYGRLVVLYENGHNKQNLILWHCKCDCGNEIDTVAASLNRGYTKSCGCLRREYLVSKENCHSKTHGMKNTRVYNIWRGMKLRCHNPNSPTYEYYGARGIKVCDRWRNSFKAFYNDMKDGYSDELSIDRIDFDGNYEPNNCRWATQKQQCNNTRRNVLIEYNGEVDTVMRMCKKYGAGYDSVIKNIRKGRDPTQVMDKYRTK